MEDVDLIQESIKFMILGMTVVFSFLTILIVVVNLQAKVIARFFKEETPATPAATENTDKSHHVAAIIAAVTEFRKNK
jgi:oxaloacetate decarboxylase gamma subunit